MNNTRLEIYRKYIKRLLDIIFSILALPILSIVFIIVAPMILLEDNGPVFYNAPRLGKNRKVFIMYKFRSMKVNAPDLRNEDGTTYNAEDDPRVTKIGRILRRTSIDELPQLINVLIGNMSFVGPRPTVPFKESNDIALKAIKADRYKVRPGITGYSQAYYRNSISQENKFDLDTYYAANITFKLDVKILLKTVISVVKKDNIYNTKEQKEIVRV